MCNRACSGLSKTFVRVNKKNSLMLDGVNNSLERLTAVSRIIPLESVGFFALAQAVGGERWLF